MSVNVLGKAANKILIVEDDPVNAKFLSAQCDTRNFENKVAGSGEEAIELLDSEDFDLVLLDVILPKMSGFEVLEHIRKSKDPNELPVIIVSGKEKAEDTVRGLELGANDYIVKPINMKIANARIDTQFRIKQLTKDSMVKSQLEALQAMMVTYNHEINNPLMIAMGNIKEEMSEMNEKRLKAARRSLVRISEIIRKINRITEEKMKLDVDDYSPTTKMIKLD